MEIVLLWVAVGVIFIGLAMLTLWQIKADVQIAELRSLSKGERVVNQTQSSDIRFGEDKLHLTHASGDEDTRFSIKIDPNDPDPLDTATVSWCDAFEKYLLENALVAGQSINEDSCWLNVRGENFYVMNSVCNFPHFYGPFDNFVDINTSNLQGHAFDVVRRELMPGPSDLKSLVTKPVGSEWVSTLHEAPQRLDQMRSVSRAVEAAKIMKLDLSAVSLMQLSSDSYGILLKEFSVDDDAWIKAGLISKFVFLTDHGNRIRAISISAFPLADVKISLHDFLEGHREYLNNIPMEVRISIAITPSQAPYMSEVNQLMEMYKALDDVEAESSAQKE